MSLTPLDNAYSELQYNRDLLRTMEINSPRPLKFLIIWNQRRKVARLEKAYYKLLDA